jgi:hypothetical protein
MLGWSLAKRRGRRDDIAATGPSHGETERRAGSTSVQRLLAVLEKTAPPAEHGVGS